jgi:hypothetical protein
MRIKVPSPEVVSKIDAGEVMETASSAVTKLAQNSINAGATEGSVEISHICVAHLGALCSGQNHQARGTNGLLNKTPKCLVLNRGSSRAA